MAKKKKSKKRGKKKSKKKVVGAYRMTAARRKQLSGAQAKALQDAKVRYVKFAESIVQGKSQKQASIDAGYAPGSAEVQGSRLIRNAKVRDLIILKLNTSGLTQEELLKVLKAGLKATKLYGKEGIEHPDFTNRLSAVRTGLELHGVLGRDMDQEEAQDQMAMATRVILKIVAIIHEIVKDKGLKRKIAQAIQKEADRMRVEQAKEADIVG